jgi:CheY-like chemotaxis protein
MLTKMGHEVILAKNGNEAVAKSAELLFDLVFMDVQMPELDGLEATRLIRRREESTGHHVPIVAMTAHAMQGDDEHCREAGMDGYLSKPLGYRDIQDAILRYAATYSRVREVI